MEFAAGSVVETVVTLVAAAMMTVAGLAMIEDLVPATAGAATLAACPASSGPAG